jgi:hypothetical protein
MVLCWKIEIGEKRLNMETKLAHHFFNLIPDLLLGRSSGFRNFVQDHLRDSMPLAVCHGQLFLLFVLSRLLKNGTRLGHWVYDDKIIRSQSQTQCPMRVSTWQKKNFWRHRIVGEFSVCVCNLKFGSMDSIFHRRLQQRGRTITV